MVADVSIVSDLAGSIVGPVTSLISEFITDKDKQAEIGYKIATLAAVQAHDVTIAQIEVNKESAKSASVFVAGGRPAAIWMCVIGLSLQLVFFPLVVFGFSVYGRVVTMPEMDTVTLMGLLTPLLGLGVMRGVETIKGKQRHSL